MSDPNSLAKDLRRLTLSLLDSDRPAYSLRKEVLELRSVLETGGGRTFSPTDDLAAGERQTIGGVAISPAMAAMCVDDLARTVQFIRGVRDAIGDASRRDGPVRILYAGCGPLAPLAIPLMTVLRPSEAVFTILDIHEESVETVRRIVKTVGFAQHVTAIEVADAASYEIDTESRPDVIIVEMLRAALEAEPQVAVARHLLPQAPEASIVPEDVSLELVMVNPAREFDLDDHAPAGSRARRDRIVVGRVLTVDRDALLSSDGLPHTRLTIPEHDPEKYEPMICTSVRTYSEHVLKDYDSGVTCPRKLETDGEPRAGDILEFSYEISQRPGLRVRRLDRAGSNLTANVLFLLLFVLLLVSPHHAQTLTGTVTDKRDAAVPNAEISTVRNGSVISRTLSDSAGRFSIISAPDNTGLVLRVTAKGFARFERPMNEINWPFIIRLDLPPLETTVSVSITRTETGLDETPASVAVLDRDDLDSTAAQTLDDSLRRIPGFTLFRRSSSKTANPTTQGANLRGVGGSGAARTAVQFEGVSLNDAFGGWTVWSRIPKIAIDQVEVLRGGASSLFGSSAVSGAVELSSSRRFEDVLRVDGSGGSQATFSGAVLAALNRQRWHAGVAAESFQTAGYIPTVAEQRGSVDTPANSRHTAVLARLDRWIGDARIHGRVNLFTERRDNGTALTNNWTQFRNAGLGADFATSNSGTFRVRAGMDGQVYEQTFSAVAADRNSENLTRVQRVPSRAISTSVTWSASYGDHALNAQGETRYVRGSSQEVGVAGGFANTLTEAGGKEFTIGISAQDLWRITRRLNISIGGRFDRWREFDGLSRTRNLITTQTSETIYPERAEQSFSPRLAAIYKLTTGLSLFGSYSRSFRAPSLNELYRSFRVGNVLTLANENLRAETADTLEAGARWRISKGLTLRTNVFQTAVDDPVVSVTLTSTPTLITRRRENVGETRSRGLEADAEVLIGDDLRLNFGYLLVDSRVVDAGPNTGLVGKRLPQIARQQFTSQLVYRPRRLITFSLQARASDAQFDDDLNSFRLRPYFTLDAYAAYRLRKRIELFTAVENVFDHRYDIGLTPVRTIASPRSLRAGFRFELNRKD